MANYYFLITVFPPLTLGVKPAFSFDEVKDLLIMNLSSDDWRLFAYLLRPIDLYNLRALWLGAPFDLRGTFEENELEEELLVRQNLPEYLIEYLERYESREDRLRYFASLYASLYREEGEKQNGFLAKYYRFEREVRLILVALRAKESGADLVFQLQFEDPFDPLVALILAQKDASEFIPPREYEGLKHLFEENLRDPRKLDCALLEYRFHKIEEMEEAQDFGIQRVLAYIARLMIAEAFVEHDLEKGMEQLSQYE